MGLNIARFFVWVLAVAALPAVGAAGQAPAPSETIGELREELRRLRERDEENRRQLERLERQLERLESGAAVDPQPDADRPDPAADVALEAVLADALREVPRPIRTDLVATRIGGVDLRLIDVSLDVLTAVGTSTEGTASIQNLQGGAHDPLRRGFTLQQAELSLMGAVDPYLTAAAHIVFFPGGVELEEAFFQTTSLPFGLQLEGGYFLTEFGLINPTHPHAWDWLDQPIINSRLFGGDGTRSPGFRLGWLTPLPWFSELHYGMQNADGDGYTPSFIGGRIGGRPSFERDVHTLADLLHLARWHNSWDLTSEWTASLGASGLFGPNDTGPEGRTFLYGADLRVRWRPLQNFRGWPYLTWQTEIMKRDYTADWFLAGSEAASGGGGGGVCHGGHCHGGDPDEGGDDEFPNDLPGAILRDVGVYSQLLYGFRFGWSAGLRYEYATARGGSVRDGIVAGRQSDPTRDDRHRLAPLIVWQPTHFSRLRLQYNFDRAKHLDSKDAHTLWLGAEVFYGAHPAHAF